jgi:hypothetical protein
MDASAYAFVHGIRSTRGALADWNDRPWNVLKSWLTGSVAAASVLLVAVWLISLVSPGGLQFVHRPPLVVGGPGDVIRILGHNLLVLALHAMACVAGFIAGASLPLQVEHKEGVVRWIHERGGRVAIGFVICATGFSLTWQAVAIGMSTARVASALHGSTAVLLAGLLPHALPELTALFLPLAAWIVASRRGEWDQLMAATLVTVALAVPVLIVTATWEVYVAPHVIGALLGY